MALAIGIYLNSQHPQREDPGRHLRALVEQVETAERLGFDSIWAGEHHLTDGFHFFPQLTLLSHLAAYSGKMAIGTNLVLLPLHRPVDIAEQVALIDHACGGRFILTVGQGYRPEEFAAFGVPFEERLPRMVDGIEVIRRLWHEDGVDHDGGWYQLKGATVRPGPARPGGPPIWIGATTDRAIARAGRIGDAFMAAPNTDNDEVRRQIEVFASARAEAGLAPAVEVGRMLEVHVHGDGVEARRRAAPHLLTKYAAYASWGLTGSAGDAARSAASVGGGGSGESGSGPGTTDTGTGGTDGTDHDGFAALAHNRFVIGGVDEVVEGLVAQHRDVGATHLAMRVAWPGSDPDHALECIELLGNEVLPAVRAEVGP
jgi:alkanesulfonate monooxygenase SsuD/methylene tetrahydromethanopterin reductase-like flavin-dependent oxidoreductase (luciferase family)